MPYLTETEYSNIQKQLEQRNKLVEICRKTLSKLILRYGGESELINQLQQAIK